MNIIKEWNRYKECNQLEYVNSIYGSEYVYIIFNEFTGLHKIGITTDCYKRYSSLCTSSGVKLKIIMIIELSPEIDLSSYYIETFLHNYFGNKRGIGEWFNLNKSDVLQIRELFWESIMGEMIWDENVSESWVANIEDFHLNVN